MASMLNLIKGYKEGVPSIFCLSCSDYIDIGYDYYKDVAGRQYCSINCFLENIGLNSFILSEIYFEKLKDDYLDGDFSICCSECERGIEIEDEVYTNEDSETFCSVDCIIDFYDLKKTQLEERYFY